MMENQSKIHDEKAIPAGYKLTEAGVIPDDWDEINLNSIVSVLEAGVSVNSIDEIDAYSHGKHILKTSCVFNGHFDGSEKKSILPTDVKRAKCSPVKGGIIVSRMNTPALVGEVGYVAENNLDSFLPDRLWQMKFKKDAAHNPKWLATLLSFPPFSKKIKDTATGTSGSMKNISKSAFLCLKLPWPTIKEQNIIGKALSDTDALITALEQLLVKKKAIKTASMQQLLTGHTRLPLFSKRPDGTLKSYKLSELGRIPEDWEVHPLGYLLNDSPRYGINAPAVKLGGSIPVYIRITDISDNGYFRPTEKVGVNSPHSDSYILQEGDIVLARTGASVGKSYLYKPEDGTLVYAGFLIKITPDQRSLNSKFLFQFLQTQQYWNWIATNSMRSGQPGVNGNEFASLPIPVPAQKEQTAIATILSDMDAELEALEQKLAKFRDIKQGMMQQLLTGRIRLPLDQQP